MSIQTFYVLTQIRKYQEYEEKNYSLLFSAYIMVYSLHLKAIKLLLVLIAQQHQEKVKLVKKTDKTSYVFLSTQHIILIGPIGCIIELERRLQERKDNSGFESQISPKQNKITRIAHPIPSSLLAIY